METSPFQKPTLLNSSAASSVRGIVVSELEKLVDLLANSFLFGGNAIEFFCNCIPRPDIVIEVSGYNNIRDIFKDGGLVK